LLVLTILVVGEAIHRLVSGTHQVHGLVVLVVSAVAAVVMLVGAIVLWGDDDDDDHGGNLNMRAVLLDTVADAVAAGTVSITGAVIVLTKGYYWLDPAVALLVAGVISWHAFKLVRKVIVELRSPASSVAE
jgi:cobalt-zinc-cadmium efflux system protein